MWVQVYAVDKNELNVPKLQARAKEAGVDELVLPVKADARALPFAADFFDAVFCLNSYFYFGTDDLYLPYLMKFVAMGGRICVGSPCYREEPPPNPPEEWLVEFPDCLSGAFTGVVAPAFEKSGLSGIEIDLSPAEPGLLGGLAAPLARDESSGRHEPARIGMVYPRSCGCWRATREFCSHSLLVAEKIAPIANSPNQHATRQVA